MWSMGRFLLVLLINPTLNFFFLQDSHGKLGLIKQSHGSGTPVKIQSIGHPVFKIASGTDHLAMVADNGTVGSRLLLWQSNL